MDELFDKLYEADFKRSLGTALVTGAIGAGAAAAGWQKGKELKKDAVPLPKPPVASAPEVIKKGEPAKQEWQEVEMRVTAYCPCEACTGTHSPGITASQHKIEEGDAFVAAGRKYPFGTKMIIPGYNNDEPVKVEDRGGAISDDRVDVFFPTHEQALEWGVQNLIVKVEL